MKYEFVLLCDRKIATHKIQNFTIKNAVKNS